MPLRFFPNVGAALFKEVARLIVPTIFIFSVLVIGGFPEVREYSFRYRRVLSVVKRALVAWAFLLAEGRVVGPFEGPYCDDCCSSFGQDCVAQTADGSICRNEPPLLERLRRSISIQSMTWHSTSTMLLKSSYMCTKTAPLKHNLKNSYFYP